MREPIMSGVSGGVGARTTASALGVAAAPPGHHRPVDVLICRDTLHSVALAERHLATVTGRPVLVVCSDGHPRPRPVKAKLRMVLAHTEGAVTLPWVPRWREVTDPYAEASRLAFTEAADVPKHLRDYHTKLTTLVQLVRPLVTKPPPGVRPPPAPRSSSPPPQPSHRA